MRSHVDANLPADHPVRQAFAAALAPGCYEGGGPHEVAVRAAVAAFDAMPPAEQRRVLGGWAPAARRSSRAELAELHANIPFEPCLWLTPEFTLNGGPAGDIRYIHTDEADPVRLCVRLGTRKDEVLAGLDKLRGIVDAEWARLIVDPLNAGKGAAPADPDLSPTSS
jgi:hypothetical protein